MFNFRDTHYFFLVEKKHLCFLEFLFAGIFALCVAIIAAVRCFDDVHWHCDHQHCNVIRSLAKYSALVEVCDTFTLTVVVLIFQNKPLKRG